MLMEPPLVDRVAVELSGDVMVSGKGLPVLLSTEIAVPEATVDLIAELAPKLSSGVITVMDEFETSLTPEPSVTLAPVTVLAMDDEVMVTGPPFRLRVVEPVTIEFAKVSARGDLGGAISWREP